jgi:hypothetical protein
MKNPFVQMALIASLMASAFRENAIRDYRGPRSRRTRRFGQSQERGVVPKAFRQYNKRYGSNINTLYAKHLKYRNVPTLNQAASARRANRSPFGVDPLRQVPA